MFNGRLISFAAVALLTIVSSALSLRTELSTLRHADFSVRDWIARHSNTAPIKQNLVFLAVDNDSVSLAKDVDLKGLFDVDKVSPTEKKALELMSADWPWSREVYALMLERLVQAGAKVIVFDLLFPKPAEGDDALAAALQRYADHVVIGSNLNSSLDETGRLNASITLPAPSLTPRSETPDARVGLVNFFPDSDATVRAAKFQIRYSDLLQARADFGAVHESLAARAVRQLGRPELIPTDGVNRPIRFAGVPGTFPAHSVFEIFVPDYWAHNYRDGSMFKDAVVVIGAAGNWQHDQHPTPFGVMAGPEIQLNVINALLGQQFLAPWPPLLELVLLVLAGAAVVGLSVAVPSPLIRFGLLGLMIAGWFAAEYWLFNQHARLVPVVGPVLVLSVTGVFALIYDLGAAGAEQLRLRRHVREQQLKEEVLAQANRELDGRVRERTAELTHTNEKLTALVEEKSALVEEKNVLLKEVHHRVKNNMQVISSLLNLQCDNIKDPAALEIFADSRNRVRSMALIHEKLYQSNDLARIHFGEYVKTLTTGLASGFAGKVSGVHISTETDDVMLGVDTAVPCGLIVNELVTNCFKYAFRHGQSGEIRVAVKRVPDGKLQLTVADNGVGFPKDIDFRTTESLGLQLVNTLTEQIDGRVAMRNGCGTTFEITFTEQP